MKKYLFRANFSDLREVILEVYAYDFEEARDKARMTCYKGGMCFLGRV